jgi:predicted thioesterase
MISTRPTSCVARVATVLELSPLFSVVATEALAAFLEVTAVALLLQQMSLHISVAPQVALKSNQSCENESICCRR